MLQYDNHMLTSANTCTGYTHCCLPHLTGLRGVSNFVMAENTAPFRLGST